MDHEPLGQFGCIQTDRTRGDATDARLRRAYRGGVAVQLAPLVELERELDAVERLVAGACAGSCGAAVFEGPAETAGTVVEVSYTADYVFWKKTAA